MPVTKSLGGFQDNPSLRSKLDEMIVARYPTIRRLAMRGTGLPLDTVPATCPFDRDELLARFED